MNAQRWREVKLVLQQAIDTPRTQRAAFIEAACHGQDDLRREVESLLAAHDREEAAGEMMGPVSVKAEVRAQDAQLREALETALGAQYDVLDALGSGGMGTVFLAHERALTRTVAIKVLRPDRASTPGSRERFRREARIAAQLSHPGIVPLHSFAEVKGLWYFVMEYVRGPTLAQRLELEGRISSDDARDILLAVTEAVEHAHQRGVIHRDIKPANILLDESSGRPRLADFGISKVEGSTDDITVTGIVMGTPYYMSPEQADGATDIDVRSDLYSIGAVAYTMLAGRPPHTGTNAVDVLTRRRSEEPTPILDLVPRLATDLASIVMRCLARNREARWPDATSLKNALRSSNASRLPDLPVAVADLPGYIAYSLVWMMFWMAFAFTAVQSPISRYLLIFLALVVPVGPGLHVWRLRAYGLRPAQLLQLVLRPPRWWGIWWPARLRSPGDLWPLLPRVARRTRISLTLSFGLVLFLAIASDRTAFAWYVARDVAALLLLLGVPTVAVIVLRWARRAQLGFDATMQFFLASTIPSAFWSEPDIARLLAPATRLVRPPDPAMAADHVRAIEELSSRCPEALASVGSVASTAAQRQVTEIATLEREIALLERDSSPSEVDRLTSRMTQLSRSEAESPEHRELGDAVRLQLDLVQRLQGRKALAFARRTEQFALLRALWSHCAALVEAERDGLHAFSQAEQRVHDLCSRILGTDAADRRPSAVDVVPGAE